MNELGSPESHVPQQNRREKLRVQQGLSFGPSAAFPDLVHVQDVSVSGMFSDSAAAMDFSVAHSAAAGGGHTPSCTVALPSTGGILHEAVAGSGFSRSGHIQPQDHCDWTAVGPSSLNPMHQLYQQQLRGYNDGSSDMHFAPPQFWYGGQELASVVGQRHGGRISVHPWVVDGAVNELPFLPSYSVSEYIPSTSLLSRQSSQWSADGAAATDKFGVAGNAASRGNDVNGAPTQGLSLSLSSNPAPELIVSQLENRFMHGDAGSSCSYPKLSYDDKSFGGDGLLQGAVSAPGDARRGVGPLGPFTGYATILKNSKFLKPAQLLLDEFCSVVTGSRLGKQQCGVAEGGCGDSISVSKTVVGLEKEVENSMIGGNSSSSLYSSSEAGGNSMSGDGAAIICRPEFQQKKAKLLYMQEEVCRRYKQYHQQMQMVVSSFESVAGLSSATPYASLGLKTVSKHFRSLKNAISDQLKHISKILGEELMPSPSSSRGETMTTLRLKNLDQSLRKQKSGESSQVFTDHNQPVWRPQRGLPERAVSVLRAWLFEHFLHPYPTDTDKHMLATQTGLSRNQVSNWFINARVRLWKPMVEEIHMLEIKGTNEMDLNSATRKETTPAMENHDHPSGDNQMLESQRTLPLDCTRMGHVFNDEGTQNLESWHCEKRSSMGERGGILTSMDGGLMSFTTYQHAMDVGGLGAVSLTLGLRHEGGQQNSGQMRHLENQMLHDFVG